MPTSNFTTSPLITPERLYANPRDALSVYPAWVRRLHLEYPEGHVEDPASPDPVAIMVLGGKHIAAKTFSLLQVAFMCEVTRFPGISIVTNHNGSGRYYERIAFSDYGEDLTSLNRVFAGSTEFDQTKVGIIKSDSRAENLRTATAEKIGKAARQVVLGHAERIAKALEESGRIPEHITAEAYLANLHRLLHLIDQEAAGGPVEAEAVKPGSVAEATGQSGEEA